MMRRISVMTLVVWSLAACAEDRTAEVEVLTGERDSLVAELLATATLVNQINIELADVADTSMGMALPTEEGLARAAEENEVVLGKIRSLIDQLEQRESELADNRTRLQQLSRTESTLVRRITEYEATLAEVRESAERREAEYAAIITQQRSMIRSLARQLDTAQARSEALTEERDVLALAVDELEQEVNTVYYVAGTKSELLDLGVVEEEGTKFLIFGGKTLVPARTLDPTRFESIDRLSVLEILLPNADRNYRIVSRHNPAFLAGADEDNGEVREKLVVESPEEFWEVSPFLILVQR